MCNFEATTWRRLRAHRQAEHGGLLRKHRCTRCCAQFASTKSFMRHVRRHASQIAFPCPTIGSGLPMKLQFKDGSSGQCVLSSSSNVSSSVLLLFTIWISRVKSRNTKDAQVGCNQREGHVILLSNVFHVVSVAAVHHLDLQGEEQEH